MSEYKILSFTALPAGWMNVYDIKGVEECVMCPGILLIQNNDEYGVTEDAVFADIEAGWLCIASDTSNYLRTDPPSSSNLCAMPEELVERLKLEVEYFDHPYELTNPELLRDILAWHEGQKGEQGIEAPPVDSQREGA